MYVKTVDLTDWRRGGGRVGEDERAVVRMDTKNIILVDSTASDFACWSWEVVNSTMWQAAWRWEGTERLENIRSVILRVVC